MLLQKVSMGNKNILRTLIVLCLLGILSSCGNIDKKHIILVPVYGQSLALGEEAVLITNFDTLRNKYNHHILTETLDEKFGYFSTTLLKQKIKRLVNYSKNKQETSCYGLGEYTADRWLRIGAEDSALCTFPAGQGNTSIDFLDTKSKPYKKMIDEIKTTYETATDNGCTLYVPAFCWLQGENDITHNTGKDYKQKLLRFRRQCEKDIQSITHQKQGVKCILYQSTCLSLSEDKFNNNVYCCHQIQVPQAQMELVRDDKNFSASGPTYPYSIVREYVHLDGVSQKRIGYLEGLSLEKILCKGKNIGVTPHKTEIEGNTLEITFNIQYPPLVLDTIQVAKVENYGFSVITPSNKNILQKVALRDNKIYLYCSSSPKGCKIRYGVNGDYWKSGRLHGPRGNLRDSQGEKHKCYILNKEYRLDNWCYIYENYFY